MPMYAPEDISSFLQMAVETSKDERGRMIVVLSTKKRIIISARDWDEYLRSLDDEFTDEDYYFTDNQPRLDPSSY